MPKCCDDFFFIQMFVFFYKYSFLLNILSPNEYAFVLANTLVNGIFVTEKRLLHRSRTPAPGSEATYGLAGTAKVFGKIDSNPN